jgi:hypothetical protein
MAHRKPIQLFPVVAPLRHQPVHQSNEAVVVGPFEQMHHLVNDDIFQAFGRFLGEVRVKANAAFGWIAPPIVLKDFSSQVRSYLARYDQLHGTGFARTYSNLVLRVANLIANAEGVRNEQKVSCVAQISKAVTPNLGTAPRNLALEIKALLSDCEPILAECPISLVLVSFLTRPLLRKRSRFALLM